MLRTSCSGPVDAVRRLEKNVIIRMQFEHRNNNNIRRSMTPKLRLERFTFVPATSARRLKTWRLSLLHTCKAKVAPQNPDDDTCN